MPSQASCHPRRSWWVVPPPTVVRPAQLMAGWTGLACLQSPGACRGTQSRMSKPELSEEISHPTPTSHVQKLRPKMSGPMQGEGRRNPWISNSITNSQWLYIEMTSTCSSAQRFVQSHQLFTCRAEAWVLSHPDPQLLISGSLFRSWVPPLPPSLSPWTLRAWRPG